MAAVLTLLVTVEMGSSWNFPARASPSCEGAELGHFHFRAETELTIPTIKKSQILFNSFFPPKFLLSEVLYHDFNQFHDHLCELL